jgi:hypothetical protein
VFDVRTALQNYMRMVRPGGRLVILTMANNHCGHGFYQFSPELFFRVFSASNGYRVERLHVAAEDVEFTRPAGGVSVPANVRNWRYAVVDPEEAGERVLLRSRAGVAVLVQAQRVAAVAPLAAPVQQSDYQPMWASPVSPTVDVPDAEVGALRRTFRRLVPPEARMALALDVGPRLRPLLDPLHRLRVARQRSLRNRRHYRPL